MVEKWEEERRQSEDDYIAKTCENLIRENIKSDDEEYIKSQINECIDKVSEPIKKLKDKYEIVKFCKNETDFITEIDKKKEFEDKCIIEVTEELKKREVLRDKVNLFIEDYIKAKKICDSKVSNKTNLSNQKKEYEFCIKETKKLSLQEVQVGILTSTNPLSKKIKLEKRKKIAQVFLSNKEPFTLTEIRKKTKLRSPEVKAILLYMHRAGAISKKEGKYQLTDKDKLTHIITGRPVYEKSDEKLLRRQSELIINLFKEEDKGFTTEELINKTCLTFKEVDRIIRTLRQYSLLISRIDKSKGEKYIFQKKIHQPRHFLIKGDEANKIIDRLIKGESISREDIREVK